MNPDGGGIDTPEERDRWETDPGPKTWDDLGLRAPNNAVASPAEKAALALRSGSRNIIRALYGDDVLALLDSLSLIDQERGIAPI
jgi:hypothetical protein